ncbi:MAG: alpha/beta fold hydrolase [Gordonia sp. (in: high G+C Gram-positive bacteria)]
MGRRSVLIGGSLLGAGAACGAGAFAAGASAHAVGLVRAAVRSTRSVDDGFDELLAEPTHHCDRRTVTTADGARLNVEVYGRDVAASDNKDIIVVIHGWTCNTRYWNPQINHLAGDRTVVAYDQRGHGRSELGRRRPSVGLLGRDLDAVLGEVIPPGRRAVLVGHSMGGMTIMSWAAQYPDRAATMISGVVLASTAAKAVVANHQLIPVDLPRYSRPLTTAVSRIVISASTPLPHNAYNTRIAHYMALGTPARAAHVAFVREMIAACPPRARGRWGAAMARLDVVAGLHALPGPVSVIVGTQDRLTPPTHADRIAEVLRARGTLRDYLVLDGVGHMSTIEAARRVNELLDDIAG